jgi:hypothetical protein
MSARRQPSTTSLSKYAKTNSPTSQNRSLDFCNAFWGIGDGGVDVLFARMRGAARTIEELRNYWKERLVNYGVPVSMLTTHTRASIEEDYAKRMAKLAKTMLGRDEIGYVSYLCSLPLDVVRGVGYITPPIHPWYCRRRLMRCHEATTRTQMNATG